MVSHHVGQFIAISLVIAVGLLTYVAFTMAMVNLENSLNYYYDESNFADIYVETLKVPEKGSRTFSNCQVSYMHRAEFSTMFPSRSKMKMKKSLYVLSPSQRETIKLTTFIFMRDGP